MSPTDNGSVLSKARELGALLDAKPIPQLEPIDTRVARLTRRDMWSPEAWAEIEAVYAERNEGGR